MNAGTTFVHRTTGQLEVEFVAGEAYAVTIRDHIVRVDQPVTDGGQDTGPTPTELFVASLATCLAYYAGRFLTRHGLGRGGLGVHVEYDLADHPARVATIRVTLRVPPDLPEERRAALLAVVAHCTVHNSLDTPPSVQITVA
jgi:putative redox protein